MYAARMAKVTPCDVPEGSLLAGFGGPEDYRDCFYRDVPNIDGRAVSLSEYLERFYCSAAFRPERLALGLVGHGASNADAKALARGEADGIALWKVVERRDTEALLEAGRTNTASWFAVEPRGESTRLLFGSWVRGIEDSGWRVMLNAHVWYSKLLLGSV